MCVCVCVCVCMYMYIDINFIFLEIFTPAYGEEWKKNKKFALTTLRTYGFGTAVGEAKILDQIDNMATVIAKGGSTPINPEELCRKAAACVIFGIVVGKSFTYDDPELLNLLKVLNKFVDLSIDGKIFALEFLPIWLSSILMGGFKKKVIDATEEYHHIVKSFIQAHMKNFDADNPRDVVDGYLKERGVDNFDPDVMASNIVAFTSDAVITVASIANAVICYLTKHQDIQRRIQEQLDAVVGSSRKVTTQDKSSLPLVEAAIHETLRIVTIATVIPPHITPRDTKLMGYNIPKGTLVMANLFGIHMNPETYKDPEQFRLEHFLEEDGSIVRTPEGLVPFGLGR